MEITLDGEIDGQVLCQNLLEFNVQVPAFPYIGFNSSSMQEPVDFFIYISRSVCPDSMLDIG